jgi:hypothetical protein
MSHLIDKVKEFQTTFNQPISEKPTLATPQVQEIRYKLALEELDEYRTACTNGDLVEIFDSILDQMYILYGTAHSHGFSNKLIEEGFLEVHRSNMSKLDNNGKAIYREDGKILKSDNFFPPDLKKILSLS